MSPHSTYFTSSVTVDITCQHADSCYSSKGPLSSIVLDKPKKSVSFNELVRAKKTIHISDFSAEEVRCCWYKDDDYEEMKRDIRFEVNLLENDCIIETLSSRKMSHTLRGLEVFSSTTIGRARREIKRQARNTVLEEQILQREEGSYDPEFIAEIYSKVTKAASQIAIKAAC